MLYEGLDFQRHPLPVAEVAADFMTFQEKYASDPVFFHLGGKPLTIWSGTWAYSHAAVARVTGPVRSRMLVLSTEKNVQGYQQLSDVTDGDAYYWSSVNPATNSSYAAKLDQMSAAAHRAGQYWIAPFAPGFDARLVGGTKTVSRDNGQTLRNEYATAVRSSPDVLGLISWNEFSENSYVEPSQKYGRQYLDVLHELRGTAVPAPVTANPSDLGITGPTAPPGGYLPDGLRLAGFAIALVAGVGAIGYARRRLARKDPAGRHSGRPDRHQFR
jgi:Glycosyl hydrolase family 71